MPSICKTHNKPRTEIYERKMPRGGTFTLVGCVDCAKAAASTAGVKLKPKKQPKKESKPASPGSKLRRI